MRWLGAGEYPPPGSSDRFFEIRFDEPGDSDAVDEEMRGRVVTCEAPQGSVVITFDDNGWLRSFDIS